MNDKTTLIIAHRGESFNAPENTLAAIDLAWERGADVVEIDIQLTKDNKIVVIHDENTKRTAGVNKLVKDSTLSELRMLDVGSYKGSEWEGEKIPTLTEVLKTIPLNKKIIIEIKCGPEVIQILKTEIVNSGIRNDQIEFIGFDLSVITELKKQMPEHIILWIHELDYSWIGKIFCPSPEKLINKVLDNNLDGLDLWAGKKITKDFAAKIKDAGLQLYVWTVNDAGTARKLIDLGVDGITSDRASWLKEKLIHV